MNSISYIYGDPDGDVNWSTVFVQHKVIEDLYEQLILQFSTSVWENFHIKKSEKSNTMRWELLARAKEDKYDIVRVEAEMRVQNLMLKYSGQIRVVVESHTKDNLRVL